MSNFILLQTETALDTFKGYHLGTIDGKEAKTFKTFYQQVEKVLNFPDYFGHNLDSFDELINDFEWIENPDIALYIKNFDAFLSDEKKQEKRLDFFNLLDASAEDWKWMEDEESEFDKKNFVILIEFSNNAQAFFEKEGIGYEIK